MVIVVMTGMTVMAVIENNVVPSEQAMEVMETMEATAMALRILVVALAATREVGCSSTRASCIMVDTNNKVGVATSSMVMVAAVVTVVAVKAHISTP
jgi:hypothetical protein